MDYTRNNLTYISKRSTSADKLSIFVLITHHLLDFCKLGTMQIIRKNFLSEERRFTNSHSYYNTTNHSILSFNGSHITHIKPQHRTRKRINQHFQLEHIEEGSRWRKKKSSKILITINSHNI